MTGVAAHSSEFLASIVARRVSVRLYCSISIGNIGHPAWRSLCHAARFFGLEGGGLVSVGLPRTDHDVHDIWTMDDLEKKEHWKFFNAPLGLTKAIL